MVQLGLAGGVCAVAVGAVAVALGAFAYHRYVVVDPGAEIDREHIRTIISQESPVYYRDGTTRVGVFFESEHRQYVPFGDIPAAWTLAIVAAEDASFWAHSGVSVRGIARAMRDNLVALDLVAGGSTLTQQTAKNLYYRPDRTLRSKGVELVNALRLEAHYDKAEILEFYANQFHVTGNGRGLGIAARHFFDEDVSDLSVAECAFLAGVVKGPGNYDPFLGDEERRARAIERAHERTRYVLRRLVEVPLADVAGPVPPDEARAVQDEARRLLAEGFELGFRRGTFRYESSALLDEVARRLAEAPFDAILGEAGIRDPAKAGLVVVTTLDPDAQREATWSLWHHLTEVGTWMEALGPEDYVLDGHRGPRFDPDFPPRRHEFRVARVLEKTGDAGKKALRLDLGGHPCAVDRDGVVRVAVATVRGRSQNASAKASSAEVDAWVDALPPDAVVLASVREVPAEGPALCDLEVRPELQGAVTVLQGGQIRAMVGGSDNRNFNRATALRQFGSTWKPLVYHAALTLGWSPDDVLDNTRNVFPFSTTFYYPSPDHEPAPRVSMAWAGVDSENLASIWLLYHLADRLDGEQVRALAASLDLQRRGDETPEAYRLRIQKLGVLPTRDRVPEGLFLQSRQEVLAGITTARHPEDEVALRSLLYGFGFASERNRAQHEGAAARATKQRALTNDWRTLESRLSPCRFAYGALADALEARRVPDPAVVGDLTVLLDGDTVRVACGAVPEGYVAPDAEFVTSVPWPAPDPVPVPRAMPEPRRRLFGRDRSAPEPDEPAPAASPPGPRLAPVEDVLVDDRLHLSTLEEVAAAVERRQLAWELTPERPDLYDPEVLYWHQDFRVLLAMRYVASLAEDYGIQTELREVLALPLGASEITLEEATSLYQGLVTGTAWEFPGRSGAKAVAPVPTSTLLVQEVRDVDGRVLYRADPRPIRIAGEEVGGMTADILRNVVLHGTGRRAVEAVRHGGRALPLGGKTGTTNDYRNAAFVGFAPASTPDGYALPQGFVVGSYVGYDDNRSMTAGRIRLQGSNGALPAWIGTVDGLARASLLGAPPAVAPEDGRPPAILAAPTLARIPVEPEAGLPLATAAEPAPATVLVRGLGISLDPMLALPRLDRPERIAPSTDEILVEPR